MKPFAFKLIQEPKTIGFALRFLFIDIAIILAFDPQDWYLIYLRAFGVGVRGIMAQVLFLNMFIGQNSYLYADLVPDESRFEPGVHEI